MPVEKSAGAIVFFQNRGIEYLLLHYQGRGKKSKDYWDFPKGHIEKGENEIETVRREVKEETQLEDLDILPGFKKTIKYFFRIKGENIFKIVVFYLGRSKNKEVRISEEHIGHDWLPYEKALDLTTFKNSQKILKEAHNFLKDYVKQKENL